MASGASQPVMTAAPLDDTEDASSVKGSALKRPVRLTAMDGDAPQLAEAAALMQEIRTFGRLPKEVKGTSAAQTAEHNFAKRFNKAREAGRLTAEHEAELTAMDGDVPQLAEIAALMQEIRILGRLPTRVNGTSDAQTAERNLAKRFLRSV